MRTRGFPLRMRNIAGGITRITLRYEHPASPSKLPLVMLGLNQPHLVRSDLVLFQYLQQPATTATGDWYPIYKKFVKVFVLLASGARKLVVSREPAAHGQRVSAQS